MSIINPREVSRAMAAAEIEAEARIRGDLDQATVDAISELILSSRRSLGSVSYEIWAEAILHSGRRSLDPRTVDTLAAYFERRHNGIVINAVACEARYTNTSSALAH